MYDIDLAGLKQLQREALRAEKYAVTHYDELASRPHRYTLYGPWTYDIGASVPSTTIVPVSQRKIMRKTRRSDYTIYQLDEEYKVIRTICMIDHTIVDCTFHHFELNGTIYAYPFRGDSSELYNRKLYALKCLNGKPVYYGSVSYWHINAQFFEYPSEDKMLTSIYHYVNDKKTNNYGEPIDENAPLDAPNSPILRYCKEETPCFVDFSYWCKKYGAD